MMNEQDQMHPEDRRNMILFAVCALLLWFVFDHYLIGPKSAALREAKQVAAVAATVTPPPRGEVLNEGPRLPIDTPSLSGSVALTGGRLDDISLKNYFTALDRKENVVLFSPAGTEHPHYAEFGWIAGGSGGVVLPGPDTPWEVRNGHAKLTPETPVTLTWNNGQGLRFERTISVDDKYVFTVVNRVFNNSSRNVSLYPYSLVTQHGLPKEFYGASYVVHEGPIGYTGDKLTELSYKKIKDNPDTTLQNARGWIGIDQKYWFAGLIPDQKDMNKFRFLYTPASTSQLKEHFQTDLVGSERIIAPGQSAESAVYLFSGAKELKQLKEYEARFNAPHLELVVDFGLYYFLTKPFFYILHFFGSKTGNLGIAILILTLIVRLAVFPLANTSFRSFANLRKIAPMMKELRDKYPDDKAKLQEELVKLYEKEKVNPMAGCLPILIQIPIFFALYKVFLNTIEMRHAPFFGWVQDLSSADPTSVFNLFGFLPYDIPAFLPHIGAWPCLMLFFMLMQRQLNPPAMDKSQAIMMNLMPFFLVFIMAKFAAGLVIYWTFSNALSILQQYVLLRSMNVPVYFFRKPPQEKEIEKALESGPAVHPGLEMIEEKVEDALFGDEGTPGNNIVSLPKPKKKKKK